MINGLGLIGWLLIVCLLVCCHCTAFGLLGFTGLVLLWVFVYMLVISVALVIVCLLVVLCCVCYLYL